MNDYRPSCVKLISIYDARLLAESDTLLIKSSAVNDNLSVGDAIEIDGTIVDVVSVRNEFDYGAFDLRVEVKGLLMLLLRNKMTFRIAHSDRL